MATFRVGQRVRIVSAKAFPHMVGKEAVIVDIYDAKYRGTTIAVDVAGFACPDNDDGLWRGYPHNFEPLQPQGAVPVEWSACLWTPEREAVPA